MLACPAELLGDDPLASVSAVFQAWSRSCHHGAEIPVGPAEFLLM